MSDLIHQVEAILFSIGKKVDPEYIRKLCRVGDIALINEALEELMKNYDATESSLQVVKEGEFWKLMVREKYSTLVRKIVPDTEMTKTVMETLAVIAWKQPILQAEVIRIRTNKAYDHIKVLTEMGFVTSERYGRTRKLRLTQKFLDYFDLKGVDDIKELFRQMREKEAAERKDDEEPSKDSEVARLVDGIRQAVEEQSLVGQAIESSDSVGDLDVYKTEPAPEKEELPAQEFSSDDEAESTKKVSSMLGESLNQDAPTEEPDEAEEPVKEKSEEPVPQEPDEEPSEDTASEPPEEPEESDEKDEVTPSKKLGDLDRMMENAEERKE